MNESWMLRLQLAVEAGYYRTESAEGEQTPFPWQNKTCGDCPFWLNGVCRVQAVQRDAGMHTCSYFDSWNHHAAQRLIENRMKAVRKMWRGKSKGGREQ